MEIYIVHLKIVYHVHFLDSNPGSNKSVDKSNSDKTGTLKKNEISRPKQAQSQNTRSVTNYRKYSKS